MMNEVRIDRLERMVALLDKHIAQPEINFDLRSWVMTRTERKLSNFFRKTECNTAACAIGLALVSREFESEGLHTAYGIVETITPAFEGATSFEAISKFFGLNWDDTQNFFSPLRYEVHTGKEAAKAVRNRICKFIGNHRFEETKKQLAAMTPEKEPA